MGRRAPSSHRLRQAGGRAVHAGFTLVELMVGLALGLFILAGLTALYMNAKSNFRHQDSIASLQGTRRAVILSLSNGVRSAGYFVDPLRTTRATIFAPTSVFARGQFIGGADGDATTSDSVSIRFETQPGDGLPDCLGNVNSGTEKKVVQNTFTVNAQGALTCQAGDAAATTLVGGIARMELRYSVDTDGDGEPDSYLSANAVTAADAWSSVAAVRAQLIFRDTAMRGAGAGAGAGADGNLLPLVHIIPLMNRI